MRAIVHGQGKELRGGQTYYFEGAKVEAELVRPVSGVPDVAWVRFDGEAELRIRKVERVLP